MSLRSVPRPWRYLLVASLALNLAVVGVVVGSAFDRHGHGRGPHMAGPMAPLIMSLPEDAREGLIDELRSLPRPDRDMRRRSFDALLTAIRAEPFRPEAVTAALREQRDLGEARLSSLETVLADQLAGLSAEERADYADRLRTSVRRRP